MRPDMFWLVVVPAIVVAVGLVAGIVVRLLNS